MDDVKISPIASTLWSYSQSSVELHGVPTTEVTASIFQADIHSANQSPQFVTDSSGVVGSGASAVSTRTPVFSKGVTEPCTD